MSGMLNTYYDVSKLSLWGEKGNQESNPRFALSFRDGNPRFVTYTGEIGSIINFPCDYRTFVAVLEAFEFMLDAPKGARISIDSKGRKYVNGQRTDEIRLVSVLHIGKSKEGVIFVSLVEEGKPKIAFAFNKNEWHDFRNESGEDIPVEVLSRWYAAGYLKLVRNAIAVMLVDYTREAYRDGEYKPTPIDNGNNKGKFQGKNNNNYGKKQNQPSTVPEMSSIDLNEDILF